MNMKRRLFMSRHKKKKSNDDSVTISTQRPHISSSSSSIATIVDEAPVKNSSKRKLFRKHKSKSQKSIDHQDESVPAPAVACGKVYEERQSPNVVLRRATKLSETNHNPSKSNRKFFEQRVPNSVSSSRTASSASSSSSRRWSNRRPWSLVESFHNPTPLEFTKYDGDSADQAPGPTFTTQSKTSEDETTSDKENNRNKGFLSDLFVRRFKRSSSGSNSLRPSSSDERLSLRVKSFKTNKDSKNRRSWHPPSQAYYIVNPNNNLNVSSGRNLDLPLTRSYTNPPQFRRTEPSEYGRYSAPAPINPLVSESSGSHSSVSTVVSIKNHSSRVSSDPHEIPLFFSDQMSNRSSVQSAFSDRSESSLCSKCLAYPNGAKRNLCYCSSAPLTAGSSLNDSCSLFRSTISSLGTASQSYLGDSSAPTSPHRFLGSGDTIDDSETDYDMKRTIADAQKRLGGSLIDISKVSSMNFSDEFECTLTRRNVNKPDPKLNFLSKKSSVHYASSPQLNSLCVKAKRKWTKSGNTPESNNLASNRDSSTNSPSVDSPIKRAIGFPGVVLRRHRQLRNASDTSSVPAASGNSNHMSRDTREKQVFSLNLEDLPTYNQTKNSNDSDAKPKAEDGRGLSSFAILYQRLISNGLSSDNAKELDDSALDEEDLINLLLMPGVQATGRDTDKSGQNQEPTSKRVKTLRKSVASFANLISPRGKLQRSSSFNKESLTPAQKPSRNSGGNNEGSNSANVVLGTYTPGKKRTTKSSKNRCAKLWRETFDCTGLDEAELKRQEAIFEVYQGECDMVQDLKMAKQTYRDSMMTLKMLSDEEVSRIFGKLDCLLPLHEDFITRLEEARLKNGRTDLIGDVFIKWFPTLSPYNEYCANQSDAKETLDAVISREKRVRDFLQRCLESPFSRKLDLWSYLDLPRSRLVKYPLLLKAILKVTPPDHQDVPPIEKSLALINEIIARVDDLTGERQCKFVQSKLEYLDEKKRCPEVEMSRKIVCSGQLKNSRGTKLQVFLFDLALVLTRNATRRDKLTYQVYRQPLPLKSLTLETEEGGKLSGSFRGNLLISDKNLKYSFRVKSEQLNVAYTLTATDEHDRKQWLTSLQESINKCQSRAPTDLSQPSVVIRNSAESKPKENGKKKLLRRSSSGKSDSDKSSDSHDSNLMQKTKAKKLAKKLAKMSPNARNNRKSTSDDVKTSDLLAVNDAVFDDGKTCRRSRSLTASPVSLFNAWNGRRRANERSLTRSESGTSKPPSGKQSRPACNSTSKTPSRSPRLHATRSTPDLFNFRRSPVLKIKNGFDFSLPNTIVTMVDDDTDGFESTFPSLSDPYQPDISHLIIDSPDHPAASDTSQNFPILEEDSITPVLKSFSSIHSSLSSPSISISFPGSGPLVGWQSSMRGRKESDDLYASSHASSESFVDAPLAMDDVDLILESAETDDAESGDMTFTHCLSCSASICDDVRQVVENVLDSMLSHVCDGLPESPSSCDHTMCSERFITITADDGTPWRGDRFEMSA